MFMTTLVAVRDGNKLIHGQPLEAARRMTKPFIIRKLYCIKIDILYVKKCGFYTSADRIPVDIAINTMSLMWRLVWLMSLVPFRNIFS